MAIETTDVLIIGTGFGGSIPGYYLAAGGARVIMLERGPRLATEFTQSLQVGGYTRILDSIAARHQRHRGQLRRRLERRLLRGVAAGAELRLRAARHARPSYLAGDHHPQHSRPAGTAASRTPCP
jgi:choline dehydrogenase-like flavoprotein